MQRIHLQRIVCAVDLSDRSADVLTRALFLAGLHGAELLVLHVTEKPPALPGSVQWRIDDVFLDLRRLAATSSDGRTSIRWIVVHGNPAIEMARYVRCANADLVVMSRSSPRPSTGVVGTVAEAILRTTSCPVLAIPPVTNSNSLREPFHEVLCAVSSSAPLIRE